MNEPNVNQVLTKKRRRRHRPTTEFAGFVRRIVKAYGRRIGGGDIDALPELATLAADVDRVLAESVAGLRAAGHSWVDIATRLGVSRQAAQQRFGRS